MELILSLEYKHIRIDKKYSDASLDSRTKSHVYGNETRFLTDAKPLLLDFSVRLIFRACVSDFCRNEPSEQKFLC